MPQVRIFFIIVIFSFQTNGCGDSKVLPPIVAETTAALREWNTILRQKFLEQVSKQNKSSGHSLMTSYMFADKNLLVTISL